MQMTINWHLTELCNYSCKYCHSQWGEKSPEIYKDNERVNEILAELSKKDTLSAIIGIDVTKVRINFAGGEPLILGKTFVDIVKHTKELGFETSLITNGFLLESHQEILQYLDIIGISIDSLDENICKEIGRNTKNGDYLSREKLTKLVYNIKQNHPKVKLKFNVVVCKYNYNTNIVGQLQEFEPDRLKILRQLPFREKKGITDEQFAHFLEINKEFFKHNIVLEDENDIIHSYLMVDPQGRFFQNGDKDRYKYSDPIYDGLEPALLQIPFDKEKYQSRYGRSV